jgi:hypothetical protein
MRGRHIVIITSAADYQVVPRLGSGMARYMEHDESKAAHNFEL